MVKCEKTSIRLNDEFVMKEVLNTFYQVLVKWENGQKLKLKI